MLYQASIFPTRKVAIRARGSKREHMLLDNRTCIREELKERECHFTSAWKIFLGSHHYFIEDNQVREGLKIAKIWLMSGRESGKVKKGV